MSREGQGQSPDEMRGLNKARSLTVPPYQTLKELTVTDSRSYRRSHCLVLLAALLVGPTALADADVEGALDICREQCLPACIELAEALEERSLMEQQVQEYRQACSNAPVESSESSKLDCLRAASEHFQGSAVESLCSQPTRGTAACIREAAQHYTTVDAISQLCSGARPGTDECIREAGRYFSTVGPIAQVCARATRDRAACVREALTRYSTAEGVSEMCSDSGD